MRKYLEYFWVEEPLAPLLDVLRGIAVLKPLWMLSPVVLGCSIRQVAKLDRSIWGFSPPSNKVNPVINPSEWGT